MEAALNAMGEMLAAVVGEYFMEVLSEAEHFDLMTLMRRIYASKGLMDFSNLVENGLITISKEEDINLATSHLMHLTSEVRNHFQALEKTISVEDMKKSRYRLRKSNTYSFMEIFWAYYAWQAWGSDELYSGMLDIINKILSAYMNQQTPEMNVLKPVLKLTLTSGESDPGYDLLQEIFMQLDVKLTTIKERVINGSVSMAEASNEDFVLLH